MVPTIDARQLIREGRTAEALAAAKAAHAHAPGDTEAKLVLGIAYALNEQAEPARPLLEAALAEQGAAGDMRHWRLLGQVCAHMGDTEGEVAALREATRRAPADPVASLRLSAGLLELGRHDEALQAAAASVRATDTPDARRLFVRALHEAERVDAEAVPLVNRALAEGWARSDRLQGAAVRLLRAGAPISRVALLTFGPIRDPVLELEHTDLRRRLLDGEPADLDLRAGLATQAFYAEYAWAVSPAEAAKLAALGPPRTVESLLTLAAYRSLDDLPDVDRWLGEAVPEPVRRVLRQQVAEPRRERELAPGIATLTPILAGASEVVRSQYEQNPYPRWVHPPASEPATGPERGARSVLVAGCGTGRHAVSAGLRYPGADVLAVDLSRASLAYAVRKTEEHGVANVRYAQADLLALEGMTFDVIECAGVLHHLEDPFEGMRVLRRLLRPGGLMMIGLYSKTGRKVLEPAQRLAKAYAPTPEGIRALRQAILAAPKDDPVRAVLPIVDFYSTSMCRDLLMHTHEHLFTIAELQRLVEGFAVVRWAVGAKVRDRYRAMFPDDPDAVDFGNWQRFEAQHPDTFRGGLYQLWLRKVD